MNDLKINVCSNGAFAFHKAATVHRKDGIRVSMGTDEMGPVSRYLESEEIEKLFAFLGAVPEATAMKLRETAAEEMDQKWRKLVEHEQEAKKNLRRVLRLFRDFAIHGTGQWKMGAGDHHHPMWEMVSLALGDDNDLHPTQAEWSFIYPENREPLK